MYITKVNYQYLTRILEYIYFTVCVLGIQILLSLATRLTDSAARQENLI